MYELEEEKPASIKVIGIGGGGCNAVKAIIETDPAGATFYIANTDFSSSAKDRNPIRIQMGEKLTKGLGAGADPEVGKKAAEESLPHIIEMIRDADMFFVAAGLGGGTGTGAAPLIAKAARGLGILTIGVVTMPFLYEGKRRFKQAEVGLSEMQDSVDSLIVISNNRLAAVANKLPIKKAFEPANDILGYAIHSIVSLIQTTGLINVDFADVKTILSHRGRVIMGTGMANGEDRAETALLKAVNSPLLEGYTLDGAKGILVNICGSPDMTMDEFHRIQISSTRRSMKMPLSSPDLSLMKTLRIP